MSKVPDVRAGDVWADCDKRKVGRTMRVDHVDERYVYGESRGRKVRIARRRMRPNSTGWVLMSRLPTDSNDPC